MKKYIIAVLAILLLSLPVLNAQISINTESQNATLSVNSTSRSNPSSTTGVIVPRVQTLNTTDAKEDGLIVFLDNPTPPLSTGEYNGYYYWDSPTNKWIPFQARYMSGIIDKSQFLCTGTTFKSPGVFNDANSLATINLDNIKTNNPDIGTFADGGVTVHQTGWYYVQLSVTLTKNANPVNLRDIVCVGLNINGLWPTGYSMKGCNSYANGNGLTNSFTLYAPIKLSAGDFMTMVCIIDMKDGCDGPFQSDCSGSGVTKRVNASYTITANTIASMSVRYLGDF